MESALEHIRFLKDSGFDQMKISLKSSNVLDTIAAYERLEPRAGLSRCTWA